MAKVDLDAILDCEKRVSQEGYYFCSKYNGDGVPRTVMVIKGDPRDDYKKLDIISATGPDCEIGLGESDAILYQFMRNNIKAICLELQAARECVEFLRKLSGQSKGSYALDGIPYREIDCLVKYEEATK